MIIKIIIGVLIVLFGGLELYGILRFQHSKLINARLSPDLYLKVTELIFKMDSAIRESVGDRQLIAVDPNYIKDWPEEMKANSLYVLLARKCVIEGQYFTSISYCIITMLMVAANCLEVFNGWLFYLFMGGLLFSIFYGLLIFREDYPIKKEHIPNAVNNVDEIVRLQNEASVLANSEATRILFASSIMKVVLFAAGFILSQNPPIFQIMVW